MNFFRRIALWFHRSSFNNHGDHLVEIESSPADRAAIDEIETWIRKTSYSSYTSTVDVVCVLPGCGYLNKALDRALALKREILWKIQQSDRARAEAKRLRERAELLLGRDVPRLGSGGELSTAPMTGGEVSRTSKTS